MILKNAKVFADSKFRNLDIKITSEYIVKLGENLSCEINEEKIDCTGKKIIPGIIDIHTHGRVGEDFSKPTSDGVDKMLKSYAKEGVTSVLGTTMTMSKEDYRLASKTLGNIIREGMFKEGRANLLGLNMEGSFLSVAKKGAHDEKFITPPDIEFMEELDNLAGGSFKLIDIDPIYEESKAFIEKFSGSKTISLAHTPANYDQTVTAIKQGVKHLTHLFNAMDGIHHRNPGPIGAFVYYGENSGVNAEIITDGFHIHPAVVKMMFNAAKGRMIIISDSLAPAGLPDGEYVSGGLPITINNGQAYVKGTNTIAGSTANAFQCMKNVISYGVSEEEAIKAATELPAKVTGSQDKVGKIEKGFRADLLIVSSEYNLEKVYVSGKEV